MWSVQLRQMSSVGLHNTLDELSGYLRLALSRSRANEILLTEKGDQIEVYERIVDGIEKTREENYARLAEAQRLAEQKHVEATQLAQELAHVKQQLKVRILV